jgi:hypothetical protein
MNFARQRRRTVSTTVAGSSTTSLTLVAISAPGAAAAAEPSSASACSARALAGSFVHANRSAVEPLIGKGAVSQRRFHRVNDNTGNRILGMVGLTPRYSSTVSLPRLRIPEQIERSRIRGSDRCHDLSRQPKWLVRNRACSFSQ